MDPKTRVSYKEAERELIKHGIKQEYIDNLLKELKTNKEGMYRAFDIMLWLGY